MGQKLFQLLKKSYMSCIDLSHLLEYLQLDTYMEKLYMSCNDFLKFSEELAASTAVF